LIELNVEFRHGVFFAIPLVVPAVIVEEFAGLVDACTHIYPIDPKDVQWDSTPGTWMAGVAQ
jgi:hypothetical protein